MILAAWAGLGLTAQLLPADLASLSAAVYVAMGLLVIVESRTIVEFVIELHYRMSRDPFESWLYRGIAILAGVGLVGYGLVNLATTTT